MFRLLEVLLYTPDMSRMRAFYERAIGLRHDSAGAQWTSYPTRGALLALRPTGEGQSASAEITFATDDLEDALRTLRNRGVAVPGDIEGHAWGRRAPFRDPEGNALAIVQLTEPPPTGEGLRLGSAVVHTRDLAAAKAFYQHALGLKTRVDSPWWVEFEAGAANLALRPRPADESESMQGRALSFGFRMSGLMEWAEEARERGLHFATAPRDEDWGVFADANDPDGNEVRFYEPADEPVLEEELAEPFDDDAVPHQIAIRKPLKKASKAASRVAIKPAYKAGKSKGSRRRPSATTRAVASVRGAGPDRTRATPKRTGDEKKAKVKPAQGRLRKAKASVLERKKRAGASASRGKPVKRAAARKARKGKTR